MGIIFGDLPTSQNYRNSYHPIFLSNRVLVTLNRFVVVAVVTLEYFGKPDTAVLKFYCCMLDVGLK